MRARSSVRFSHLDEIHLGESLVVAGFLNVKDGNDIFMIEVAQKFHLSQCAEAEHGVVEWSDLLDGDFLARGLVKGRAGFVR